ncbi:MAG: glycoside-pentoside-hexuronide (GPH):cation symporter [Bacillota bacterium]|nr:glycoside-pentoside-hexuronide (GPH):cation symporter [Bacillota bacterium]
MENQVSSMNINDKKYLTKFNIASFALAGFGQNLIIGVVNSFILFFYTDVYLLGAGAAGILMIVARVWDALNDPIMSTIVDKTKTKRGKMRPYLMVIPIPLALSTISLFLIPDISYTWKVVYAYVTYILWGMIYTVCDVPFWGLASVMTPNPKERISFISFSRLIHTIGGALPVLIIPLFVDVIAKGDNAKGFPMAGIAIGIIGAALFSLSYFGTKERCTKTEKAPTLKECIKLLGVNKPLRQVVLANVLGFMRTMPVVSSMYMATYIIGPTTLFGIDFSPTMLNIVIVAGWGVAGYIGMLTTPLVCKKINYKQIYYISSVVGVFGCLLLLSIGPKLWAIMLCMLICGLAFGYTSNINYAMIADSVDYVEWKTGKRNEGVTVSFQTLMNKLMYALQTGLVSLVLIIIKFVEPVKVGDQLITQQQSDYTLKGFFFMITVIPAIGWLVSAIPMKFYSFIGEERALAHQELGKMREERLAKELSQENDCILNEE